METDDELHKKAMELRKDALSLNENGKKEKANARLKLAKYACKKIKLLVRRAQCLDDIRDAESKINHL